MRIPPFRHGFSREDAAFVAERLADLLVNGRHLTMGQYGEELEAAFAARHGVRHAVAVASGTAALEILLRAVGVEGREVVVPTNTFGATPVAVLRAGGIPVFADCGEDMALDPEEVERRLSGRTAAVVAVHIGGSLSAALARLARLCDRQGVALIEDAAHATGASLGARSAGAWGAGGAFSFFSTKVMTSGEGGMLVTNDGRIRDVARRLRDHAKEADGSMEVVGYNWRLTEAQALIGLTQLRRLDDFIGHRARVAARYRELLAGVRGLRLLEPAPDSAPNYYKQIVVLEGPRPTCVRELLARRHGVALGGEVYRLPCHRQAAFRRYASGPFPRADLLCPRHICPPILPDMTEEEMTWTARSIREAVAELQAAPAERQREEMRVESPT
jgi:perosamine synthetase